MFKRSRKLKAARLIHPHLVPDAGEAEWRVMWLTIGGVIVGWAAAEAVIFTFHPWGLGS